MDGGTVVNRSTLGVVAQLVGFCGFAKVTVRPAHSLAACRSWQADEWCTRNRDGHQEPVKYCFLKASADPASSRAESSNRCLIVTDSVAMNGILKRAGDEFGCWRAGCVE